MTREGAPVISFETRVSAGSAHDPAGLAGLAQLVKSLLFKGSTRVGTRDWPAEQTALEEVDQAHGVERASQLLTCLQQDSCSVSRTIEQRDYERSGFSQLDHLAQRVVAEFGFFTLVNQHDTWTKPR